MSPVQKTVSPERKFCLLLDMVKRFFCRPETMTAKDGSFTFRLLPSAVAGARGERHRYAEILLRWGERWGEPLASDGTPSSVRALRSAIGRGRRCRTRSDAGVNTSRVTAEQPARIGLAQSTLFANDRPAGDSEDSTRGPSGTSGDERGRSDTLRRGPSGTPPLKGSTKSPAVPVPGPSTTGPTSAAEVKARSPESFC